MAIFADGGGGSDGVLFVDKGIAGGGPFLADGGIAGGGSDGVLFVDKGVAGGGPFLADGGIAGGGSDGVLFVDKGMAGGGPFLADEVVIVVLCVVSKGWVSVSKVRSVIYSYGTKNN
jgi:hypothetical protein